MSRLEELIARSQSGERDATECLVEENSGLIWSVAKRFLGRGAELDDLYQLGCLGFLKAIEGFDEGFGTRFSTYAVPKISGEIRRFLRDDGLIKVSRTLKEQAYRIQQARQELELNLGCTPTLAELARHVGLSASEVSAALASCEAAVSFDSPIASSGRAGKELTIQDALPDSRSDVENRVDQIALQEALTRLPETEAALIRLRYFKNHTQSQVGQILGMSQVQVSRKEKAILEFIRNKLNV